MGIALFTVSGLFSPLQQLLGRFAPAAPRQPSASTPSAIKSIAICAHPSRTTGRNRSYAKAARPVRVLRVVESNAAPASAGRMVISGRMADVCAELDRLAASEGALH